MNLTQSDVLTASTAAPASDQVYERIMKLIEESPVPVILLNEVLEYAQSRLEKGD